MRNAVIVDAVRVASGKGKPGRVLSKTHPVDLFAHALRSLVERNGLDPARVDDVIGGRVIQAGEQSLNISQQALVTGSASGLGLATTEKLLDAGALVVIVDMPSSGGEEVTEKLGDHVRFIANDVTTEASDITALDVAAELGDLRVAVNSAGTGNAIKTVSKKGPHPLADFSRIIINPVGSFNGVRLAAAHIAERELIDSERGVTIEIARPSDSTAQSVWLRVNQAWKCRVLRPGRDQKPKNQKEIARA